MSDTKRDAQANNQWAQTGPIDLMLNGNHIADRALKLLSPNV
jgi:hypothetical protein